MVPDTRVMMVIMREIEASGQPPTAEEQAELDQLARERGQEFVDHSLLMLRAQLRWIDTFVSGGANPPLHFIPTGRARGGAVTEPGNVHPRRGGKWTAEAAASAVVRTRAAG